MSDTVTLRWTCGLAVGSPYWQTVDIYECDECGCEFETEECAEEVAEGIVGTNCPKCGGYLCQRDDGPEIVVARPPQGERDKTDTPAQP